MDRLNYLRYVGIFIVNKSDGPSIIFFKASLFSDKSSSTAEALLLEHAGFHLKLAFISLVIHARKKNICIHKNAEEK